MMTKRTRSVLAGTAAIAAFGAGLLLHPYFSSPAHASPDTTTVAGAQVSDSTPTILLPDFETLVERYGPAVVNISVTGTMRTSGPGAVPPPFGPDDPFSQFFRRFQMPQPRDRVVHGEGSGFIVSQDGVILTNAHVVEGADDVSVKLTDRREFDAKVVGLDERTDIAVLKIDAQDLPAVKLGNSDDVKVGQWVLAIGSPFGFENSVTSGIVSAKSRALPSDAAVPFIQTDVAVNPGNSGGPLFDLDGRVVGINSQIYSRTGGYQGISFAIPINVAMKVQKQLLADGKVEHGRLGVGVQTMSQDLARAFGLDRPQGALVTSVEDDSAAGKAGLKAGDVVLAMDGKSIEDSAALAAEVAGRNPGSDVKLEVWRDHKKRTIDVKLGADEGTEEVASAGGDSGSGGRLGLAVRPLTREERDRSGIDHGVVVEQVEGAAEKAGIEPGDVLVAVNGASVDSVSDLKSAIKERKGTVALLVQRGSMQIYVPVELG
jgi:serine protease Do